MTDAVLLHTGHQPHRTHYLTLARGYLIVLRARRGSDVALRVTQEYTVIESKGAPRHARFEVAIAAYWYALEVPHTEEEILAFHWHPDVPAIPFPHVHLESGLQIASRFVGTHVPTGRVALQDILWLAIHDFGVMARVSNWTEILARTKQLTAEATA